MCKILIAQKVKISKTCVWRWTTSLSIFSKSVGGSGKRGLETLRVSLTTGWQVMMIIASFFKVFSALFNENDFMHLCWLFVSDDRRCPNSDEDFWESIRIVSDDSVFWKPSYKKTDGKAKESKLNVYFLLKKMKPWKVMSRNHAALHFREGRFYLEDTNSSNGTQVNNKQLPPFQVLLIKSILVWWVMFQFQPIEIFSGDVLEFGTEVG